LLTILCVLRSGGDYKKSHVEHLWRGLSENLSIPFRFLCLTDLAGVADDKFSIVPLRHNWPGWWSKIELFRKDWGGPAVYFDLDTIPCGALDDLTVGHRFTMLQNFWRPDRVGSGMMAWDCDLSAIYQKFALSPEPFMRDFSTSARWGDQAFILENTPIKPELWQKKFPGRVVSYKLHCRLGVDPHSPEPGSTIRIPNGASIICYHGLPRPWMTPLWGKAA